MFATPPLGGLKSDYQLWTQIQVCGPTPPPLWKVCKIFIWHEHMSRPAVHTPPPPFGGLQNIYLPWASIQACGPLPPPPLLQFIHETPTSNLTSPPALPKFKMWTRRLQETPMFDPGPPYPRGQKLPYEKLWEFRGFSYYSSPHPPCLVQLQNVDQDRPKIAAILPPPPPLTLQLVDLKLSPQVNKFCLDRHSSKANKSNVCPAASHFLWYRFLPPASYQATMPPYWSHSREKSGFLHPDLGQFVWSLMVTLSTALCCTSSSYRSTFYPDQLIANLSVSGVFSRIILESPHVPTSHLQQHCALTDSICSGEFHKVWWLQSEDDSTTRCEDLDK